MIQLGSERGRGSRQGLRESEGIRGLRQDLRESEGPDRV